MRRLVVIVLAGIFCLAGVSRASPDFMPLADEISEFYFKTWHAPLAQRERCKPLLQAFLWERDAEGGVSNETLLEAEREMRKQKCIDRYSRFVLPKESGATGATSNVHRSPTVIKRYGADLFVRIDIFFGGLDSMRKALWNLERDDEDWRTETNRVILDLRGNPGGYISELGEILNEFFAPGRGARMLVAEGSDGYVPNRRIASRRGVFAGLPIRILTDANTASASEWMIAMLCHDWYRDTCRQYGAKTVGKAVMQRTVNIQHARIMLTVAEWRLKRVRPDGTTVSIRVQRRGIAPDKWMSFTQCGYDDACVVNMVRDLRS